MDSTERLYLSKGDQPIYIDSCKISQHHIDGIRFLYKQYKKKKPGVIIQDLLENRNINKNLQIVLFLKAVQHISVINGPILILCHEGAEHEWVQQFQLWTDLCDEVVIETKKPYIKKSILINTMCNLEVFSRRDWSVVIVDGDAPAHLFKLPYKGYKIWITPVDMKEDLDTFSQIYKWVNPAATFDKTIFIPKNNDLRDEVEKAILLDVFMEDIVARYEPEDVVQVSIQDDSPIRPTRKNKDASGTKIKRSKRKIYDDGDEPLNKTHRPYISIDKQDNTTDNVNRSNDKMPDLIKDCEMQKGEIPTNKAELDEDKNKIEIEKITDENKMESQGSEVLLYFEPDSLTNDNSDRIYEMDTLELDDGLNGDGIMKIDDEIEKNVDDITKSDEIIKTDSNEIIKCDEISKDGDDEIMKSDEVTKNGEAFKVGGDITKDGDEIITNDDIINSVNEINDNIKSENIVRSDEKSLNEIDLEARINNEIGIMKNDSILSNDGDKNTTLLSENNTSNEMGTLIFEDSDNVKESTSNNEIKSTNEVEQDKNTDITVKNEINNIQNEKEHIEGTVTRDVSQIICNFEDKVKEMEAKALKKFKGSILDSLF